VNPPPVGSGRGLVFVPTAGSAPPSEAGRSVVVLDVAWTPSDTDRPDLLPLRTLAAQATDESDLYDDALAVLDAWAERSRIADRMTLGATTYWYRVREDAWRWLHERMLWERVVTRALDETASASITVPGDEVPLAEVANAIGRSRGIDVVVLAAHGAQPGIEPRRRAVSTSSDRAGGAAPVPGFAEGLRRGSRSLLSRGARFARRLVPRAEGRPAPGLAPADPSREDVLARRVRDLLADPAGLVLVLTYARLHQQVGARHAGRPEDPNLGPVIRRLGEAGLRPVVVGIGLDLRRDADWRLVEPDARLLPESLLGSRWRRPGEPGPEVLEPMRARAREARSVSLRPATVDLAPALVDWIDGRIATSILGVVQQTARVGSLMDELRPRAMILTHEALRTSWLTPARDRAIPSYALQHGVIYPTHPGYRHARDPRLVLPDVTFVYGPYERDVLLTHGGYRPAEVIVSGSPRLAPGAGETPTTQPPPDERAAIRRDLEVGDGELMLVISTGYLPLYRRFVLAPMLERLFGGPLPGVHLVFKQHPGETDEGPYRGLIEGLARAHGLIPPAISVVRDVDLYGLLRAADAHLGMYSTVLTDAVAAGTPNLIVRGPAGGDLLGYVAAGVAQPVRDREELLAALAAPPVARPEDRAAFLARHFRKGDAAGRIASVIGDVARRRG